MGGDGRPLDQDICPVDKLFLNYNIELGIHSRESQRGWARETYEVFRINRRAELEDNAEELARQKLKLIISFLESMKAHIEKEGRKSRDFKKVLVGQKYTTQEVLEQITNVVEQLTTYL
eukprot:CAMPEP_0168611308 /NCGR_PEP_ID=MMETSP0449_2-20121227/2291_1 /TAXON_ID=1082188 /ORGANISM="Strombidium rassoulzadegani, Strain ras09" /LENGTH=118 /DNA_ID=CAMNT_0008651751 /DNA_START=18 /DNA_END=374 /DNA_ORIENTATION=-